MFNYTCLNPIAGVGLDLFSDDYKKVDDLAGADAALVRSAAMHDLDLPDSLLAVARAGAGVNNIPLDKCADKGIVVFNTPGANANGVKELVFGILILAFPMTTFDFFFTPEIMYAISGGAFTYPSNNSNTTITTITAGTRYGIRFSIKIPFLLTTPATFLL